MIEKQLKEILKSRNLKPVNIYGALGIDKVVYYQTLKTKNLNNKTLHKILRFLNLDIKVIIMEKEIPVFNLDHCNPTVKRIKEELEKHTKVWVGFNEKRYFIIDNELLERFAENLHLEDDDLIEGIF